MSLRCSFSLFLIGVYIVCYEQLEFLKEIGNDDWRGSNDIPYVNLTDTVQSKTLPTLSFPTRVQNTPIFNSVDSSTQAPSGTSMTNNNINTTSDRYHLVQLHLEEAFMWQGRQRKLCKRLKKEEHGNKRLILALHTKCKDIHRQHRHGNFVYGLLAMHIAAAAHDADLVFTCYEKNEYENLFWWMQSLPSDISFKRQLLHFNKSIISKESACSGMGKIPLSYTQSLAKYDLRRMAISLFGPRTKEMNKFEQEESIHSLSQVTSVPLFPDTELDSVALHFRCGDVLSNLSPKQNRNYGLLAFSEYRNMLRYISLENDGFIESIGIITAPFSSREHQRKEDSRHADKCKELVTLFHDYLQQSFPQSRVKIRNDSSETIPMVYGRMIMATQGSICVRSSFCTFAVLSSFAARRIFLPGGVTYFVPEDLLWNPPNEKDPIDNYLLSHQIHELGWNQTLVYLLRNH